MDYLLKKIKEYNTIIIHRHTNPDLDALGSQLGLKRVIELMYPDKKVYAVGDENRFSYIGRMDEIGDEKYEGSLVLLCDVSDSKIISDKRYFLGKEVIIIDHHANATNISTPEQEYTKPLHTIIIPSYCACTEIITEIIKEKNLPIDEYSATRLYGGLVTDSGRFQFGSNLAHAFEMAAFLMEKGADAQYIYKKLYVESLELRKQKTYFQSKMQLTKNNVAYMINDKDVFDKFEIDAFTVSRGMVNLMAGIDGVNIWANFTYDVKNDKVMCEFRSRDIKIVDVAKKYGGGGHDFACGATIDSFDLVESILNDFDILMEEYKNV